MFCKFVAYLAPGSKGLDIFLLHLSGYCCDVTHEKLAHCDVGAVPERAIGSADGEVVGNYGA